MIDFLIQIAFQIPICIAVTLLLFYISNKYKSNKEVKRLLKVYKKCTSNNAKVWYNVEDHLPEPNRWVLAYSDVFCSYCLAYLDPACGWCNGPKATLRDVTAWCDDELFLPFAATGQINHELAERKGLI